MKNRAGMKKVVLELGGNGPLVVLDDERRPTGVIHLHDLLRAGIA